MDPGWGPEFPTGEGKPPASAGAGPSQYSVCEFRLFYHFISFLQAYVLVSLFLFRHFSSLPPKTYIYLSSRKLRQQQQPDTTTGDAYSTATEGPEPQRDPEIEFGHVIDQ